MKMRCFLFKRKKKIKLQILDKVKKVQHTYIDNYENYHDREDYFELYT